MPARWQQALGVPNPLGLAAFGTTTALLGFVTADLAGRGGGGALVIACALWLGGLAQLVAGIAAFVRGDTFSFTVFTLYGTFWVVLGVVLLLPFVVEGAVSPSFGAFALFNLVWAITTLLFLPGGAARSLALGFLLFLLFTSFVLLSIGNGVLAWGGSNVVLIIAGYTTLLDGLLALYIAGAELNGWPLLNTNALLHGGPPPIADAPAAVD